MPNEFFSRPRVVSGMRPTGPLHLGHLHGVLKNWVELQEDHDCFFFVADLHALTTHYQDCREISPYTLEMLAAWLAVGVDPQKATLFIQSWVPAHAELFALLSMIAPLGWLERVPTYKDQKEALSEKDLNTYGFLGYPLLQAADVLLYDADAVPVGEDQVAHLELCREVARHFNHLFGAVPDLEDRVREEAKHLGEEGAKKYFSLCRRHGEKGDATSLEEVRALLRSAGMGKNAWAVLWGYFLGKRIEILKEPQALLARTSKLPGLDGRKMAKSYYNFIGLKDKPEDIEKRMRAMVTDPARKRRSDPGNPHLCPVWSFHEVYSDGATKSQVTEGCTQAKIGCLECKAPVIGKVTQEVAAIGGRIEAFLQNRRELLDIAEEGAKRAGEVAQEVLLRSKRAMGLAEQPEV